MKGKWIGFLKPPFVFISADALVDLVCFGLDAGDFVVERTSMLCKDKSERFEAYAFSSKLIVVQLPGGCKETFCSSKRELYGGRVFIADLRNAFFKPSYYIFSSNISTEVSKTVLRIAVACQSRSPYEIAIRLDRLPECLFVLNDKAHFVFQYIGSMLQCLQCHLVSQAVIGPYCSSQSANRSRPSTQCANPAIAAGIELGEVIEFPACAVQHHPGNDNRYRNCGPSYEPNLGFVHVVADTTLWLSRGVAA